MRVSGFAATSTLTRRASHAALSQRERVFDRSFDFMWKAAQTGWSEKFLTTPSAPINDQQNSWVIKTWSLGAMYIPIPSR